MGNKFTSYLSIAVVSILAACTSSGGSSSGGQSRVYAKPPQTPIQANFQSWMSTDIRNAWKEGFAGQGTTIIVADEFSGSYLDKFGGNINGEYDFALHGHWVSGIARLVAPEANLVNIDRLGNASVRDTKIRLSSSRFNIINASYGSYVDSYYRFSPPTNVTLSTFEQSIVDAAKNGTAVIVFAAGNDGDEGNQGGIIGSGVPYGDGTYAYDIFALALRDKQSVIFAGALDRNGTVYNQGERAEYSSYPGRNRDFQERTLMVGVDSDAMGGLEGTSFAAPIISGYAAIVASKFEGATPTQVTNQLLDTARTDTIKNYNPFYHGQGEASLSRALAPAYIE